RRGCRWFPRSAALRQAAPRPRRSGSGRGKRPDPSTTEDRGETVTPPAPARRKRQARGGLALGLQRTNVWRKVTSPAREAKRLNKSIVLLPASAGRRKCRRSREPGGHEMARGRPPRGDAVRVLTDTAATTASDGDARVKTGKRKNNGNGANLGFEAQLFL